MSKPSALSIYRKLFASTEDGLSAYWYFGTVFAEIEGLPIIPVIQAETVMIYRTTTLSETSFRMDWWEIGYLRDPVTGEIAESWTNPATGARLRPPSQFEEGPAHFVITQDGETLKLDLVQAHAAVQGVEVEIFLRGDRVALNQTERKIRGFPLPDGSMPSLDSGACSQATTVLSLFGDARDLDRTSPNSSGTYEFILSDLPPWMGFGGAKGRSVTRGIMVKAAVDEPLNPTAWKRLQALFPERFEGGRINPLWD